MRALFNIAVATSALFLLPVASRAEASGSGRVDVEIDPTAFVLNGYSLHAGIWVQRLRIDLGAFAMDLPEAILGNSDFDASFNGYGVKLQYFPFSERSGAFFGVDGGVSKVLARSASSNAATYANQYGAGTHLGWRFAFGSLFYATAWMGVGYAFNAEDATLDGKTLEIPAWTLFPAIHLGKAF